MGMVESALEFLRICEKMITGILSCRWKQSNTQIMVQAYRLLIQKCMRKTCITHYTLGNGGRWRWRRTNQISCRYRNITGRWNWWYDSCFIDRRSGIWKFLWRWIWFPRYTHRNKLQSVIPSLKKSRQREIASHWSDEEWTVFHRSKSGLRNQSPDSKYPAALFSLWIQQKIFRKFWISRSIVPRIIADFSHKDKLTPASFFLLVITIQSLQPINGIWVIRLMTLFIRATNVLNLNFRYFGNNCGCKGLDK